MSDVLRLLPEEYVDHNELLRLCWDYMHEEHALHLEHGNNYVFESGRQFFQDKLVERLRSLLTEGREEREKRLMGRE